MNILLVWATNSGTTQTVASMVNDALIAAGHTVTMKEAREAKPEDFNGPDAIVLGSPSWDFDGQEGMTHEDFIPLMDSMKTMTIAKPFAVFALGDMSYRLFCGAATHLEEFVAAVKGTLVVPSLKIDNYYSDAEGNNAKVASWVESLKQKLAS